jgi:hypothetical protein
MKYELNCETGEVIVRELTDLELEIETAELTVNAIIEEKTAEAKAQKAADKAALLAKLGITDDEAKLLLL